MTMSQIPVPDVNRELEGSAEQETAVVGTEITITASVSNNDTGERRGADRSS